MTYFILLLCFSDIAGFDVFLIPYRQMTELYVKLGYDRFLSIFSV
jgi:hypothetical protein